MVYNIKKYDNFRVREGYKIEVIDSISNNLNKSIKLQGSNIPNDYYGKEYVNICRQIRNMAIMGRIKLDKAITAHKSNSGNNIHLLDLIEACGIKAIDFIQGYLSVIQPFVFEYFQKDKQGKNDTWIADLGYRVQLVIKVRRENNGREMLLISFHESNRMWNGTIGQSVGGKDFSISDNPNNPNKLCAILADRLTGEYKLTDVVSGKENKYQKFVYSIQRGFLRVTESYSTDVYKNDLMFMKFDAIKDIYDNMMSKIYDNILGTYYDGNRKMRLELALCNTSILAMGFTPVNNLILLIDCYATVTDIASKRALVEIAGNIIAEIPVQQLGIIKQALENKYNKVVNYTNKLYTAIIGACTLNLNGPVLIP